MNAIEEKITLTVPERMLTMNSELGFLPINLIQYLTTTQATTDVTMAIFMTFIPKALNPPSAKSKD